ncbi:hypothetical protein P8452_42613 [Trifolium repens]|nr:hypothetical protein P8452_42613 [Trifolium repens]
MSRTINFLPRCQSHARSTYFGFRGFSLTHSDSFASAESPSSFSRCLWPTRLVREIPEASFRLGADQPQLILL